MSTTLDTVDERKPPIRPGLRFGNVVSFVWRPWPVAVTLLLALVAFVAFCASIRLGAFPMTFGEVLQALVGTGDSTTHFIVMELRMPRALVGLLVGAALGMSGAIVQSIARNPLASPDILGVAARAREGAGRWDPELAAALADHLLRWIAPEQAATVSLREHGTGVRVATDVEAAVRQARKLAGDGLVGVIFSDDTTVDPALSDEHTMAAKVSDIKGLEFDVRIAPEAEGRILIDARRLRQTLHHLAQNAVKFTAHGRVGLTVRRTEDGLILDVSDTGCGMDDATRAGVFRLFEQADATTSRAHEGAGVGLALAKTHIDFLGGTVTVESVLWQGSTITLTVPAPSVATEEDEAMEPLHSRRTRVLIVDDHPLMCDALALTLKISFGRKTVRTARSLASAPGTSSSTMAWRLLRISSTRVRARTMIDPRPSR